MLLLLAFLMQIISTRDAMSGPFPKADHRIAYGSDPQQFGDLRIPHTGRGPFPVAIVIHGGCWQAQYDLEYMSRLGAALAEKGVATWTIEYRRIGNGGGVPSTFDDVTAATKHLNVLAGQGPKQYPLDIKRVVAVGHSAGGQLALWLSSAYPLKGVVSLAGVNDLRGSGNTACGDAGIRLLGPTPDYKRYSPIEMLPLKVPQRLIHGAVDPLIPVDMSRAYEAAAKKSGDDVTLMVVPNAGHFELVTPQSNTWATVEKAVLTLLGATM